MAWSSIASICHFSSLGGTGTLQSHAIPIFFVAPIMSYRSFFRIIFPKQAKQRYIPPCPCSHGIALQLHWQAAHQRPGLCQSHSATPEDFLYLNHVAWKAERIEHWKDWTLQPLMGFSCYDFYINWKSDDWVVPKNMDCHSSVTAAKALSLMSSNALNIKDKDYRQLLFNWSTTSYLTYSALYHFMLANPIDPIE